MAAKAKAPAKAKKAPVAKTKTKAKAKPKGLVLSSAQWKAYNKAYNATASAAAQRVALTTAANRFRKYRLQAAYATIKQANIATGRAQTAAIAAFAAHTSFRQSTLSHQNAALNTRIGQDAFRHETIAGRMQFAQSGVKAYAHTAVMRTVDNSQARSHEQAVLAAAARAARAGKKSVKRTARKPTAISAAINKQASAAGLKAAKAVKGSAKVAKATAKKAVAKSATAKASGAQSAKAPVKAAKTRTAPYRGVHRGDHFDGNGHWILGLNDFEGTCIMTAVANALYHQTKWRLPDEDIAYWTGRAGRRPTIGGVLFMLFALQPWPEVCLEMPTPRAMQGDRIIGFGKHAAFALGDSMISYAEKIPIAENIEEAWSVEFTER